MSKELTPIEELIHELEETIRIHGDDSLNGLLAIERARELLAKEKKQREEEIKKAVIYGIEYGEDYLRYNHNQVKKIADSYYNTHLKK
jgi:predicted TIM-barrel enzyme